jgi:predicted CoA-substrate-specific enzyme activase
MSYYLGVDIGSETSKAVVVHEGVEIAFHSLRSGINYRLAANKVYEEILTVAKLSTNDIVNIVATGQGASMVEYAKRQVADMRCCAKGMLSVFPLVRTLIDVEAQSTQVMRLDSEGQIINFMTSERCAAGAGRFVDIIANVLQIPLSEIGQVSLKSKKPITFTTACAVFGESEAVSRVAEGVSIEDILAGVHKALAEKIGSMVERAGPVAPYGICGGGALNIGLVEWVARTLKVELLIPPHPQFITAYGAAIFASEPSKIDKFIM